MHYLCARCHHEFAAEAEGEIACPNCKAEGGLERVHGVPVAMKLFGMVLAAVAVFALGGGLVSRMVG
ncbi:MAG: hypothetical protein KDK70_29975 [Myxococcales bacterium]|nr:hypothetical protein [Myxococcales bacterium]